MLQTTMMFRSMGARALIATTRQVPSKSIILRSAATRYMSSLGKPSSQQLFHSTRHLSGDDFLGGLFRDPDPLTTSNSNNNNRPQHHQYEIPHRIPQKIVSAEDAVSLIRDGDTVSVSGFVAQGAPEAILQALGERFEQTSSPSNLSLVFGGGPGDWDSRGLNHLAKAGSGTSDDQQPSMLKRTIGSHYGQIPKIAQLALDNSVEAWTLPLGSISRMLRAQSTHSPGHITTVGLGTYVDPDHSGGAANEAASHSSLDIVSKIKVDGQDHLMYKALPIDVAIIRGTTADPQGNITMEEESLLCDQMITAAAARNSGGLVIAQVKRIAANGSLPSKQISVPGALVDCVVVVDPEDHSDLHPMSYVETSNPGLTGQLRPPKDEILPMPLDIRKIIARRASFALEPDQVVNLGIGLPEGVASVAAEENMLQYLTLSTEPGVFGGLPSTGHSFGPAVNANAVVEMNQMFDFYDGGGLDQSFLGAAQISASGDVNVSRMSQDRLTGPGGFIDISQSTENIVFLLSFTAKGLQVELPGDGTFHIAKEGKVKKFVPEVFEKTFSGDEAVRRGQTVTYVTERAVFQRTTSHDKLELIEIAPGLDLQRDVLDQMDFEPVVSPHLKTMDSRIFENSKMNLVSNMFGSILERYSYQPEEHALSLDLFGITLNTPEDVQWFIDRHVTILESIVQAKNGQPVHMKTSYNGFDLNDDLRDYYVQELTKVQKKYYASAQRFAGHAFRRAKLGKQIDIAQVDGEDEEEKEAAS